MLIGIHWIGLCAPWADTTIHYQITSLISEPWYHNPPIFLKNIASETTFFVALDVQMQDSNKIPLGSMVEMNIMGTDRWAVGEKNLV